MKGEIDLLCRSRRKICCSLSKYSNWTS